MDSILYECKIFDLESKLQWVDSIRLLFDIQKNTDTKLI